MNQTWNAAETARGLKFGKFGNAGSARIRCLRYSAATERPALRFIGVSKPLTRDISGFLLPENSDGQVLGHAPLTPAELIDIETTTGVLRLIAGLVGK